tara:strand:- start:308 stop:1147 length:840 start_codon:yes stop_codon:yes gene_type:complete
MGYYKDLILNLSLKKVYAHFFLNDYKKTGYFNYIKEQYFEFLLSKFPNLNKEKFDKTLTKLINLEDNNYNSYLYDIFEPEYTNDLDKYYKMHEKQIFLAFLKYALNIKLIKNKYVKIYDFAIQKIMEPLEILEIGGGVPHGLIFNTWKKGKNFCKHLTYIEANMLHSEFVNWYCNKNSIPIYKKYFPASTTPSIDSSNYNFVFAKDIFEHLENPGKLIDNLILFTKNPKTLLCLDLEHKGAKTIQHINPNLPPLKQKLLDNNFKVIKKFDEIHIWEKTV